MSCEVKTQLHELLVLGEPIPAEYEAHVQDCATCLELQSASATLNSLLALDEEQQPRPGFDTAFFARLKDVQNAPVTSPIVALRRWLWPAVLGCMTVAGMLLFWGGGLVGNHSAGDLEHQIASASPTRFEGLNLPPSEDFEMLAELDVLQEYEVLERLEEIEEFELLAEVDLEELEAMLKESQQ